VRGEGLCLYILILVVSGKWKVREKRHAVVVKLCVGIQRKVQKEALFSRFLPRVLHSFITHCSPPTTIHRKFSGDMVIQNINVSQYLFEGINEKAFKSEERYYKIAKPGKGMRNIKTGVV